MTLTTYEKEDILFALNMRINYIATGNPILSPQDMKAMGKNPPPISYEQMSKINQLMNLKTKIEN